MNFKIIKGECHLQNLVLLRENSTIAKCYALFENVARVEPFTAKPLFLFCEFKEDSIIKDKMLPIFTMYEIVQIIK